MWVVKLGGSLAGEAELRDWLRALAPLPVVIVPGGGPFADAVRHSHARWHFGDQTAHDMAILAMQQYGRMLADLGGGIATFDRSDPPAIRHDKALVWLPDPDSLTDIPPSWDVTSDSLAAWLTKRLGAADLLLVKAAFRGKRDEWGYTGDAQAERLAQAGLVDPVFPGYVRCLPARCWLCGTDQFRDLAASLARPESNFLRLAALPDQE